MSAFTMLLQVFFAKVPRTATQQQIAALFAAHGEVVSLNLFTPYEVKPPCELADALASEAGYFCSV